MNDDSDTVCRPFTKLKFGLEREESSCSTSATVTAWPSPRGEDISSDIVSSVGRYFEGSQKFPSVGLIDVLTSYNSGHYTERAQCYVTRDRSNLIYPTYELRCGVTDEVLIIAKKMSIRITSSFHFFDMTELQSGKNLSRKSGNFIGKLKCTNLNGTEYILRNNFSDVVAGFTYSHQDVSSQSEEPNHTVKSELSPRKLFVVMPFVDCDGLTISESIGDTSKVEGLKDILRCPMLSRANDVHAFVTKSPVLLNGNFRLNFNGRVSVPSIKNFQLITEDELDNVILQFGKTDDDSFNLDFKAPFNAFQAFALALTQFLK